MTQILTNTTENSTSVVVEIFGGGKLLTISGTFGAATATAKFAPDGTTTYADITDGAFTAETVKLLDFGRAHGNFKLTITGSSGGAPSLSSWLS